MSQKVNFIYRLEGKNISDGFDVFELAPILLSVGELIKESNKILNPGGKDVAVNVKPFQKGSFIVDIVLFAQNNFQQIIDFVNNENVREIKELLEWIGIISGGAVGTGGSLVWLIKKLKGKPKTVEQLKPNEVRYTGEDGNTFTVNSKVHQLFSNYKIQNFVYGAYGKPLESDNIESVECYIQDEKESTKEVFGKSIAKSLKNYSEAHLLSLAVEEEVINSTDVFVSPKRGSFDADPRQWSFRLGGTGEQILKATIKDEKFLEQYRDNKIRLHYTDVLKVRLIQKLKKIDGVINMDATVNEVEKVLEYYPASKPIQAQVFPTDDIKNEE
ncbi:MAG TPA: hypothetical protein P5230_04385 [Candidatus Magasanikbacteria bacterium]|nr:hypothetical protein [Candidatus Magasanikbacteria bacterium]